MTNVIRKSSEKTETLFQAHLVISLLVGIILSFAITSGPIDWKLFFYIMAMGFTSVWVAYSIILFG